MTDQDKVDRGEEAELFGTYAEDKPVSKEEALDDLQTMGEVIGGGIPIVGDVIDAKDFAMAAKEGDVVGMAMAGLGFIPFIGGALRKGAEPSMELYRAADRKIQVEGMHLTAKDLGHIPNPSNPKEVKLLIDNMEAIETQRIAEYKMKKAEGFREDAPEAMKGVGKDKGTMYHGTGTEEKRDIIDKEGFRAYGHSEIGELGTSVSRDPIYSARHFAKGDVGKLFEVSLTPDEVKKLENLSPRGYDLAKELQEIPNRNFGQSGVNLPKNPSFASEHETVLFNSGQMDPEKINLLEKVNPEKAQMIKRGVQEAEGVFKEQERIFNDLTAFTRYPDEQTPANARRLYTRLRDNMKSALGLAKYTEDNSARGTYDWYIKNFADRDANQANVANDVKNNEKYDMMLDDMMAKDPEVQMEVEMMLMEEEYMTPQEILAELGVEVADDQPFEAVDVLEGLDMLSNKLSGEQNSMQIERMIDSIKAYREGSRVPDAGRFEMPARTAKEGGGAELRKRRTAEIKEVVAQKEAGEINDRVFEKRMDAINDKYKRVLKPEADEAKESGFMTIAEKMNEGGLVS